MNRPLATAVEQHMNVIVSSDPGTGVVTQTLKDLHALSGKVFVADAFNGHLAVSHPLLSGLDRNTEIIVFDEVHLLSAPRRELVEELLVNRTLNGVELPELKSVVVFFTHRSQDTDAASRELAALAPSLELTLDFAA